MRATEYYFFGITIVISLCITLWAAHRNTNTTMHYTAGSNINWWQNGLATAGDFLAAAAFLGITGAVAMTGVTGFYLAIGVPSAFLVMLLLVAEPLRNLGNYTVADVFATRFKSRSLRGMGGLCTFVISIFHMIGQFAGSGLLLALLLGISYNAAVIVVGILISCYVFFGGMLAVTWIQIFKTTLLGLAAAILFILTLAHYGFNPMAVFDASFTTFGLKTAAPFQPTSLVGRWDMVSLNIAVGLGIAGMPFVLIRFLTVRDPIAARNSAALAIGVMGAILLSISIIGSGAALIVGRANIIAANPAGTLSIPLLAQALGGSLLLAFVVAAAFATMIAAMAGAAFAASGAFAHDCYATALRNGQASERERFLAARISAAVVLLIALALALGARNINLAILGIFGLSIAASTMLPVMLLTIHWRRFNDLGAQAAIVVGLITSVGLIVISPTVLGKHAIFPLIIPAIVSVPVGFVAAYLGTLCGDQRADASYDEVLVRASLTA